MRAARPSVPWLKSREAVLLASEKRYRKPSVALAATKSALAASVAAMGVDTRVSSACAGI